MSILKNIEAYSSLTDLKLDNIMVKLKDPSVIEDFAQAQIQNSTPRKTNDRRPV